MGDIPQWGYQAWQGGIGELGVEWNYCNQEWAICSPQPQACAFTGICNNCAGYLAKPFKSASCCQSATPQPCFESVLAGANNNAKLATPSSAPATITDPNLSVCATALSGLSACEAATSSFTDLDASVQASCLCYNSGGSFAGSVFDGPWSSCVAWAQTADTTDYPALSSAMGFCSSFAGQNQAQQSSDATGGSGGSAGTGGVSQASKTSASPGSTTQTSAPQTSAAGSTASTTQKVATSGGLKLKRSGFPVLIVVSVAMLFRA
ncbi:hypothetical protein LTR86_000341 [Recurvomyces mirabilis]|nr:hypothetical protein LTR86_000341 [Recurvomyces mirabilis]